MVNGKMNGLLLFVSGESCCRSVCGDYDRTKMVPTVAGLDIMTAVTSVLRTNKRHYGSDALYVAVCSFSPYGFSISQ
jgi:hypothetical protein